VTRVNDPRPDDIADRLRRAEQRLAETQAIARLGSWEWVIASDTLTWSSELCRIYGVDPREFRATYETFLAAVHPDDRPRVQQIVASALDAGTPFDFYHRIVRPDGVIRELHGRGEVVVDDDGQPLRMVGTGQDVTEQRQAEARLHELHRAQAARAEAENTQKRLAFLAEASAVLGSSLDYETTLATVARLVVPFLADLCVVDILDDPAIRPVAVAHVDPVAEGLLREMRRRYPLDLSGSAPVAEVMRSGRSLLFPAVPDTLQAGIARDAEHLEMLRALRYESAMVVPLVARATTLGTIMLISTRDARRFDESDLALAEDLARRAALAVDNARLYAAEQTARHEAERTTDRVARLQAVTAAASRALTPEQVAEVVVGQGVAAFGALAGSILLLNQDESALEMAGAVGYPPDVLAAWQRIPMDLHVQATEAVKTRRSVWIPTPDVAVARYPTLASTRTTGARAFAAVPLIVDERVIGVMGLSFAEPRDLDAADRAFIEALAQQYAQAFERARLYDAERVARDAAEAAARLREEFLSTAAHELKTPLTSIKAAAQLLDRRLTIGDADHERLHRLGVSLLNEVTRLELLVGDLLDVSRIQRGRLELRLERFDLVDLARDVLARFEEAPERGPQHFLELDAAQPVEGRWDRGRLEQVVSNLVSNALKYSPRGGDVCVRVWRERDLAYVSVADQGIGMTPNERPLLFQPFARTEAARTLSAGTGLGLYISVQIIEQHGGAISVVSEAGRGSVFTMWVPLDAAPVSLTPRPPLP
jgi:PAS domain S-box-containing protein